MPEIEPLWETLVEEAGADEDAARFLTFWTPPRYLASCSQAVVFDRDGPFLIRNYDLDPALNESTLLSTAWRGRRVAGMVEGMAGLADGMNEAGLAISLTFGGRPACGRGFGVPMILRYVLEMSADVQDAVEVLRQVPCHMSYNVTILDRSGKWATVFLAPDRPPMVTEQPYATNHQLGVEWPRHGRLTRTVERAAHLGRLVSRGDVTTDDMCRQFLVPPLHSKRYAEGFGTVYTAAYRPLANAMELHWPGCQAWRFGFDDFPEGERRIAYKDESGTEFKTAADRSLLAAFRPHNRVVEDRYLAGLNGAAANRKEET